ncbi:MAG: LysM peptidoglycan-binding domain-containing protein [Spartobacteria bacterium]
MIRFRSLLALLVSSGLLIATLPAQSPAPAAPETAPTDLLSLTKKIDEQNTKIDLLSQQILRLQQEVEHLALPAANALPAAPVTAEAPSPVPAQEGSTHVVARGETLTSIAKMHKVGIDELQKFNHIENDRKLQIGQTLVIPGAPAALPVAASPSPAPSVP